MGRPKKAPEERLVTVGTRVSPTLLEKIRSVMLELHRLGKISRPNESAACGWMIGQGMEAYERADDPLFMVMMAIWPHLNEIAHEALVGAAKGLHEMESMKASKGNVSPLKREDGDGRKPGDKEPRKPGGNGRRGKQKDDEEDERYVA